jgi:hypothetical protein
MPPGLWILAFLLTLVGVARAPGALAQGFDLTAQDRYVEVLTTESELACSPPPTGCSLIGSVNHSDSESAPDTSPFSAVASTGFGGFGASQDSSLTAAQLEAEGSGTHSGSGAFAPPPPNRAIAISGSSDSHFEVSFDVAAPTPVRLTGSVAATGGLSANSTAQIRLRTAGGATLAEIVAATDPGCVDEGCATVGPFPIEHVAVLAPGSYVLEASTAGTGAPFYFAGNFIPVSSTGQYQVTLAHVAIPALSRGAQALLALSLVLAALLSGARRARRFPG